MIRYVKKLVNSKFFSEKSEYLTESDKQLKELLAKCEKVC